MKNTLLILMFFAGMAYSHAQETAVQIIEKAIQKAPRNNPEEALQDFSFDGYSTITISGNPDTIDTSTPNGQQQQALLLESHAYFAERVSHYTFNQNNGFKETIVASRMSGFKEPIEDVFKIEFNSINFYQERIEIFNIQYPGILTHNAPTDYEYTLDGIQTVYGIPAYQVHFQPNENLAVAGLSGTILIHPITYAIIQLDARIEGSLIIKLKQQYEYIEDTVWFPEKISLSLQQGTGSDPIAIFKGRVPIGRLDKPTMVIDEENMENIPANLSLTREMYFSNNTINTGNKTLAPASDIHVLPTASNRDEAFWNQYRPNELDVQSVNTYKTLDDIARDKNVFNRINMATKFGFGFIPLGPIDLDLKYLLKYNDYEALRTGLGGRTNERFSERVILNWYSVYGFKDHRWKYQFGAQARIHDTSETWIGASVTDDLQEMASHFFETDARVYSLFEPRLVNIPSFYKKKVYEVSLSHRIEPELSTMFTLSRKRISQTTTYFFNVNNQIYQGYGLTEATMAARWTPGSKYLYSKNGFSEFDIGYPQVSFQYTRGISNFLQGDFNYNKVSAQFIYQLQPLNQQVTEVFVEAHYANGEVPLTHLFHAYPNAPTKDEILQRFSVAGRRSFETMYFNEFFSDRLVTVQLKHAFRPFYKSTLFSPQLTLITRYAIGNISNQNRHIGIDFGTLDKGYTESGLEMNNLLYGFGISLMGRYGAYALPDFEDNVSFKFTFYLEL